MTQTASQKGKKLDFGNARLVFSTFHIFASSKSKQKPQVFQLNDSGIFLRKFERTPSSFSTIGISDKLNIVCELRARVPTMKNETITKDFFSHLSKLHDKKTSHIYELSRDQGKPSELAKAIGGAQDEISELVEQKRLLEVNRGDDHTENSLLSYLDAVIEEIGFLLGLGPKKINSELLSLKKSKSLSNKELAKFTSWLATRTRQDDLSIVSRSFTHLFDSMMKQGETSLVKEVKDALRKSEERAKQIDQTYTQRAKALDGEIRKKKEDLSKKRKLLGSVEKSNSAHVEMQEKLTHEIHSNLDEALKAHGIFCKSNPIEAIREILSFSWSSKELQPLDEDKIISSMADNAESFTIFRHLIHLSLNQQQDSLCSKCQLSACSCSQQEKFRAKTEHVLKTDYEVFLRSIKNHQSSFPLIGLKIIDAIKWLVIHHENKKIFGRILSGMVVPSLHSKDFFLYDFVEPTSHEKNKAIDSIWKETALKIGIKEPDRKWLIESLFLARNLEYNDLKAAVEAQLQYYTILQEDDQAIRSMVENAAATQKDQAKS